MLTPEARLVAVPVMRLSICWTVSGVRSWKSWKTIVPLTSMSPAPLEVCDTVIDQKLPWATLAFTPGLSEVTVKVWAWVVPARTGT